MSLHLNSIFDIVKTDFCDLIDFKLRGDTIEINTAIPTLTNSYVSVFVSFRDGIYIISDGGWFDRNMYESLDTEDTDIQKRITEQYKSHFQIKETKSDDGTNYYYKTTKDLKLVSALVYDVGHYVASIVNSQNIAYRESEDLEDKKLFHNNINSFFKEKFGSTKVEFNSAVNVDNVHKIKFNAVVRPNVRDNFYVMYVTGSRPSFFRKDLTEATINFEIINEYGIKPEYFRKVAVVNTAAAGYDKAQSDIYIRKLTSALGKQPIMVKGNSDNMKLLEAIPLK